MIGFLHPEPSPPPPVANCVTSTQWCVTSTSGLIIAPVNAATLLPLLLDSIESPPSTDCPTSALARNHQIVCPSDRCLPPWHCQPHPSSYFAEIFQPSTFGMAPLPKTYHPCQIGLLSNFTPGLHTAKYFRPETQMLWNGCLPITYHSSLSSVSILSFASHTAPAPRQIQLTQQRASRPKTFPKYVSDIWSFLKPFPDRGNVFQVGTVG